MPSSNRFTQRCAALPPKATLSMFPRSVDALRDTILKGNAERFGADANVAFRISADDHVRRERHLSQIEAQWGPAPGKVQSDGSHIHVLGAMFGNVFIGVQPTFGYEGDPIRLLFDGDFTPTHAFSAYYRWIREDFAANAVLHFGTHGALEFMPGKQVGLTGSCWPERLLGDLPNFYIYASNNPSEGVIAKRRSGATLISYLTPPLSRAGLYKGFSDLKVSVERWRSSDNGKERDALAAMIVGSVRCSRYRIRRYGAVGGTALRTGACAHTKWPPCFWPASRWSGASRTARRHGRS